MLLSRAVLAKDFQYVLPPERIAQYPTSRRDGARLMELSRDGRLPIRTERTVDALADLSCDGDVWVINETQVRPARVLTKKSSGGRVELLITRVEGSSAISMYRSSKPLKEGQVLHCNATDEHITVLEALSGGFVKVDLGAEPEALLARAGQVPLPPYINREPEPEDTHRYQTVYASKPGAVAAPTAGLHFTESLMAAMEQRGVQFVKVTLHVGPGTFRPIRTDSIEDHVLDSEQYEVTQDAAQKINNAKRVVAVGTTVVRTLESIATGQGTVRAGTGETGLYITPGFQFQVVEAMLTNFHLPGSSLLVLVSAFADYSNVMAAYHRALAEEFRFYSYGDAMFIS